MSVKNTKNIIIFLLSTGFVGQVIGWWDVSKKREDDYVKQLILSNNRIAETQRELDIVKNRLVTLELASAEIPFPYWIKDRTSVILYVNNEYDDKILRTLHINKSDFINTDGSIIGDDFAKEIRKNDAKVMALKKVMMFTETIPGYGVGTSYKFPLFNNFGVVIGTAGLWIPNNPKF